MKAKLCVLKGPSKGKEITIPVSKFFIGRGEDCHLRPKSDAISRHHCAIIITDSQIAIRDFGSKNGTFVNDQRVENIAILNNGDKLVVGPLSFKLVLDHSLGGTKQPKIQGVEDVAQRSATRNMEVSSSDDDSIASWLETSILEEMNSDDSDTVTRQFKLKDTKNIEPLVEAEESSDDTEDEEGAEDEENTKDDTQVTGKKRKAIKLPNRPPETESSEDSKQAAEDMLRKYFNRS
ncbi:MAG: FHA domain-containing protein [Planctomycetota bacterium]|nr:FHA domain-containing protein [Planctomycetota bacterium]